MRITGLIACIAIVAGCTVTSVGSISDMTPAQLRQISDVDLCRAYYVARRGAARDRERYSRLSAEVERREIFSDRDLDAIRQNRVRMRMPEAGVICAWGNPDDINSTTTRFGTSRQFVYRRGGIEAQYVYTEDGRVTAWQD